jgi:hypothetical protein
MELELFVIAITTRVTLRAKRSTDAKYDESFCDVGRSSNYYFLINEGGQNLFSMSVKDLFMQNYAE